VIDGQRVKNVSRVVTIAEAGKATRVSLDLVALDGVTISGDAGIYETRVRVWPTLMAWLRGHWWAVSFRQILSRIKTSL
jgi:hypothetical protein